LRTTGSNASRSLACPKNVAERTRKPINFTNTARRGEDLIAAGLLMLVGHVDLDELD
jgi:hypothetical protein